LWFPQFFFWCRWTVSSRVSPSRLRANDAPTTRRAYAHMVPHHPPSLLFPHLSISPCAES
jgi:hypothetical protein